MSLEDIREQKTSKGLYVVIGLLLVGMAGFGTSQFGLGGGSVPAAMTLGDNEISERQFNETLSNNAQLYKDFDEATIKDLTVSQLRKELALTDYLNNYPLAASNASIDREIRNTPAFFDNGAFSEDAFHRQVTVSPETYRRAVSNSLARLEFQQVVRATAVISDAEVTPYSEWQNLSRDILVAKIAKDNFNNSADEAEIKAYYEAHPDEFMTEEQLEVEYLDFDPKAIEASVSVSDAEVMAALQEVRGVNYYLFKDADGAKAAAKALADGKSLAEVKAEFASRLDDQGQLDNLTAQITDDSLISQAAADAIFALKTTGDTTAVVDIDGGNYIFELTKSGISDREKASVKAKLLRAKAEPQIAALSEKLEKAVFNSGTPDLLAASEVTGLPVKRTGLVSLNSGKDILAIAEVNEAIQADKTVGKLQNVPMESGRVIVYRIKTIDAPKKQPLDSIKAEVEQAVIAEKTYKQLKAAADKLIAATKTEGLAKAAEASGYPTQSFDNFDGTVNDEGVLDRIAALFIAQQSPQLGDANAKQVQSMTGDVFVYVNTAIRLGDNEQNAKDIERLKKGLASGAGQLELGEFLQSIASRADIKMRTGLLREE